MLKWSFQGLFCILFLISCHVDPDRQLHIAAASSMEQVVEALCRAYQQDKEIACTCIKGSSGKLTAQITAGAPYDVFLAANMEYPMSLFKEGRSSKPEIYAYGSLILWSANEHIHPSIELLSKESVRHIALAKPELAPYGRASLEVLEHYQLQAELEDKLVYGESITQSNQFILSGAAELGFTSRSTIMTDNVKDKGSWLAIDSLAYTSIRHTAVIVYNDRGLEGEAQTFLDFMQSEKARLIFKEYGYQTPNNQ